MSNFNLIGNEPGDVNLEVMRKQQQSLMLQHDREKTALKYYLLGRGYHMAIKALGYIERIEFRISPEERFRKDGVTPSLQHQVRIALAVTQLPGVTTTFQGINLEEQCIINALLHDVQEDHHIASAEIAEEFNSLTSVINWKLTKKFAGTVKTREEYIREIGADVVASIVKGLDRVQNLSTMAGVFKLSKMTDYSNEAATVFLPMLKTASKLFPELHQAYKSIMLQMKQQINHARDWVSHQESIIELDAQVNELENERLTLTNSVSIAAQTIENLTQKLHAAQSVNKVCCGELDQVTAMAIFEKIASAVSDKKSLSSSVNLLAEVATILRISTLELVNFKADELSS